MNQQLLTDPSLTIVFSYAPAGLGHLRVTDSLRGALPLGTHPVLLASQEASIQRLHRFSSSNPLAQYVFERLQYGRLEELVTKTFRNLLHKNTRALEKQLLSVLDQRIDHPTTMVIVATHFALAHQVTQIKKRIEKKAGVKVFILVQVTDDSPQSIWYIPGADLIVVPSKLTADVLKDYGRRVGLPSVPFAVLPYPLNPTLAKTLSSAEQENRKRQLCSKEEEIISISIPISGAAVGTSFVDECTRRLHRASKRFLFHIIAKKTIYTSMFLRRMGEREYVRVYSSHSDRLLIELYEQLYADTVIALEITKPSEQSFKAMFSLKERGGALLLFTTPVGRQEWDNLAFLRRHSLIPSLEEQQSLFSLAAQGEGQSEIEFWQSRAATWRGICLPVDPKEASAFILWCHKHALFSSMATCVQCPKDDPACEHEVGIDGSFRFWDKVEHLLLK